MVQHHDVRRLRQDNSGAGLLDRDAGQRTRRRTPPRRSGLFKRLRTQGGQTTSIPGRTRLRGATEKIQCPMIPRSRVLRGLTGGRTYMRLPDISWCAYRLRQWLGCHKVPVNSPSARSPAWLSRSALEESAVHAKGGLWRPPGRPSTGPPPPWRARSRRVPPLDYPSRYMPGVFESGRQSEGEAMMSLAMPRWPALTNEERLLLYVVQTDSCWLWTGARRRERP